MYQFAHIESYARRASKGRSARHIASEAERDPDYCTHVETPQPPIRVWGCSPSEAVERAEAWGEQAKDAMGRKLRSDAPVLLAGVISYPRHGDSWGDFKASAVEWLQREYGDNLVSVIEHQDEEHPHLHFYAVPKPGQQFNDLHQGRAAAAKSKKAGESKPQQQAAHTKAMREWQDRVYAGLGRQFGLARLGPRRRRRTRAEWVEEVALAQALGAAERAGAAQATLTQRQRDAILRGVTGRDVGLLKTERMYTEDELHTVGARALRMGIQMQLDRQGDAAERAAQTVASRKITVTREGAEAVAEVEGLRAAVAELRGKVATLSSAGIKAMGQIDALKHQLADTKDAHVREKAELIAEVAELKAKNNALADENNDLIDELRELKPTHHGLSRR